MNDDEDFQIPRPQYSITEVAEVKVIRVMMAIGSGIKSDPYREVTEFWHDGLLLKRRDPGAGPSDHE